ncbi:ABC transporter permease [Bradyrhizobium pachyrhizi]|uniref:ABC transporter permease n=2 Tax=Bradyrhizobium pachyrhizi TaxID=280333 RepID=A0A844SKT1_9BRAD|nr:ABC transporter permease [Bradyrhizobium pachyrhizi]MVT66085.1 ABC transporter permease [Bradyrhizobium pachyrhizi]
MTMPAPSRLSDRVHVPVHQLILPLAVVVLFAGFAVRDPRVMSAGNLVNILQQSSFLFLFALAQTIVIIARGFDLSLGPTASMVSVGAALAMAGLAGGPYPELVIVAVGLVAGAAFGALVGAFNGAIVGYARVTPFVVTLGSFNIATGIATTLSGGHPVQGMPELFFGLFNTGSILGLPAPVVVAILLGLLVHYLLRRTVLGRGLYLVGTNMRAAEVAGLRVRLILTSAYVLSSVLTAFGALLLTARTGSGEPTLGGTLSLQSAAAAIVGGASFAGGSGGVGTALVGSIFIIVLSNGMNIVQISGYVQMIILGVIVVAGVVVDRLRAQ